MIGDLRALMISDSDTADGEKLKSFSKKIKENILLFMAFVNSSTTTLTRKLNKISRDYRYVIRTLAVEKKTLKVCRRLKHKNENYDLFIRACISAKSGFWNWIKNWFVHDLAAHAVCR